MEPDEHIIKTLEEKIAKLQQKQLAFSGEIEELKRELYRIKDAKNRVEPEMEKTVSPAPRVNIPAPQSTPAAVTQSNRTERFIGENLAGKIGIVVLIIGVALGIKYTVEQGLLSAGMRVQLGCIAGAAFIATGFKLKARHHTFGAIMVSAGISLLYLMTYSAWAWFQMVGQVPAFVLMCLLTAGTVFCALKFELPVIAHFGLIGGYLTPFLLSNNEGNVIFLFSYMVLLNAGILVLSWLRNWPSLQTTSLIFTWLVFAGLTALKTDDESFLFPCLFFSSVFYTLFYFIFVAHHINKNTPIQAGQIIRIIFNSFIAYVCGKWILDHHHLYHAYSGLFTSLHAIPHILLLIYLYQTHREDQKLISLAQVLSIAFLSIAIPVQFNGNWVTLLWVTEATLLLYVGIQRQIPIFRQIAGWVFILTFISLLQDDSLNYFNQHPKTAWFTSMRFLTPLLVCGLAFFSAFNLHKKSPGNHALNIFLFPAAWIFLYFSLHLELNAFLNHAYTFAANEAIATLKYNAQASMLVLIWLAMVYFAFSNGLFFKRKIFGDFRTLLFILHAVTLFIFAIFGEWMLNKCEVQQFTPHFISPGTLRICSMLILLLSAGILWQQLPAGKSDYKVVFHYLLIFILLLPVAGELYWLIRKAGIYVPERFLLSLWWAIISVGMVFAGIRQQAKYLRISAIIFFGITLLKVVLFDSHGMASGPKTVLYIVTGLLLIAVSWIYSRYREKLI